MSKNLITIITILVLTYSCRDDNFCRNCHLSELRIIDSIQLPVHNIPYNYELHDILIKSNYSEYWAYDDFFNMIYIFDLNNERLLDTIKIPSIGPDKFPRIWDIEVISSDSIFLFTNQSKKLFLIDHNVNILKTWDFDLPYNNISGTLQPYGYYYATFPMFGNPGMMFSNNHKNLYLYMHRWMNTPGSDYSKEEYQIPYITKFNFETEQIDFVIGKYPESYISDEVSSYEFVSPYLIIEDDIYAFFERSHKFFIYENGLLKKSLCIKSNFLSDEFKLLQYQSDFNFVDDFYKMTGSYSNLIHDPFRERILRVVAHSQPEKDPMGVAYEKIRAKWSLMIIDYNGNCRGEISLPKDKYNFNHIFSIPEGIMVSKENPYNFSNPEDYLTFDIIAIDNL